MVCITSRMYIYKCSLISLCTVIVYKSILVYKGYFQYLLYLFLCNTFTFESFIFQAASVVCLLCLAANKVNRLVTYYHAFFV